MVDVEVTQQGRRRPPKPLRARRRLLAIAAIFVGVSSFFSSLISIDPPVLGTSQWSAWRISWQTYEGSLPNREVSKECERCGQRWALILWSVPKEYLVAYLLLPIALVAVLRFRSERMLAVVGAIGCLLTWNEFKWKYTSQDLGDIFYGHLGTASHVHLGPLTATLGLVMTALLAIGLSPDLDESL